MPEFMQKKLAHKTQTMLKSVEKGSQKGLGFRIGSVSKIMKNPRFLQNGPPGFQNEPRASKITQNHENLVTQNQENPRKKTSRNGTVAGYARSALDIYQCTSCVILHFRMNYKQTQFYWTYFLHGQVVILGFLDL